MKHFSLIYTNSKKTFAIRPTKIEQFLTKIGRIAKIGPIFVVHVNQALGKRTVACQTRSYVLSNFLIELYPGWPDRASFCLWAIICLGAVFRKLHTGVSQTTEKLRTVKFWQKAGWATLWAILFTNSSGHPDSTHLNLHRLKSSNSEMAKSRWTTCPWPSLIHTSIDSFKRESWDDFLGCPANLCYNGIRLYIFTRTIRHFLQLRNWSIYNA
jgi:hypothetical protein